MNISSEGKINPSEEEELNKSYNYIEQRLKPQMNYYCKSSYQLQKKYHLFAVIGIIVTAIIPIFALFPTDIGDVAQYITAGLSTLSTIISGILLFTRYKEQWLQDRITLHKLEAELAKYSAESGPYHKLTPTERLNHLVQTFEKYMENEHNQWRQIMSKEK